MANRFGLPNLGFGLGLRTSHYPDILDKWPEIDWFEVISENFMDTDGRPRRVLERVRQHYPVVMHGVGLSVGSTDPLDKLYLKKLKNLAEWLKPEWISDHVCWTGINHTHSHDLLPLPYTEESLRVMIDKIKQVQDFLGRRILLENPSSYLEFKASDIPEWEFIARMAEASDCALLLDVNNIYVSCFNHRLDPKTYLDAIPVDRVVQIHLAGHENHGTHIVDTHSDHVIDAVWDLYSYAIARIGPTSTMVEWDENVPEFAVVKAELEKAKHHAGRQVALAHQHRHNEREAQGASTVKGFGNLLASMQGAILTADVAQAEGWIRAKTDFPPVAQLNVYVEGYRRRLVEVTSMDYPATRYLLGEEAMDAMLHGFVEETPSQHYNLAQYTCRFPAYIKGKVQRPVYELALLESVLTQVFDLPETTPLTPEALSAINPETFFEQKLTVRTASQLLAFDYATNAFYSSFIKEEKPDAPQLGTSFVAVFRHEDMVWRLEVSPGEYDFLSYLQAGCTTGEALEKLLEIYPIEEITGELQQWLARWVMNGLLADSNETRGGSLSLWEPPSQSYGEPTSVIAAP